jgi:tryptophan-rich sensory protein
MVYRLILFLVINFGALALGGIFTSAGVSSSWYENIQKAPWTPPGWVFGAAWTTIMIFFSIYLATAWPKIENKKILIGLFTLQWILNVGWNPIFFYYQNMVLGLIVILLLTFLIGFILMFYWKEVKFSSLFILPYFVWLIIATSLNWYILLKN